VVVINLFFVFLIISWPGRGCPCLWAAGAGPGGKIDKQYTNIQVMSFFEWWSSIHFFVFLFSSWPGRGCPCLWAAGAGPGGKTDKQHTNIQVMSFFQWWSSIHFFCIFI
jgi:hypothetical protein